MGVDSNPSQPSVVDSNTGVGNMPWNNAEVGSATSYNTMAAIQGTNPYNNLMDSQVDGQAEVVIETKTDGSVVLQENPNVADEEEEVGESTGRKLRKRRKGKPQGPASQASSTRPTGGPTTGGNTGGGGTTVTIGTGGGTGGTGAFSGLIGGRLQNPITSAVSSYTSLSGQATIRQTVSGDMLRGDVPMGADLAVSKVGGQKDIAKEQLRQQEERYQEYEGLPAGVPGTETWQHRLGHEAYFAYAWKDVEKAQYYAFAKEDPGGGQYVGWALEYPGENKPEGYDPVEFVTSRKDVPNEEQRAEESGKFSQNHHHLWLTGAIIGLTGIVAVLSVHFYMEREETSKYPFHKFK